jgi:hypothetical protein
MDPRSVPALARRLLSSLQDGRLALSSSSQGADFRTPGTGRAIVFETNGSKAAVPEFRPQEGLTRTIYYSRIRPKPVALGEIIAIYTISDPEEDP